MKKILVIMTLLFISLSFRLRGSDFLRVRRSCAALGSYHPTVEDVSIEDWMFGGEVRLGLLFAEASVSGVYDTTDERLEGVLAVGTSLSLFDLVHLGVGAGPAFGIDMAGGAVNWSSMNSDGTYAGRADIATTVDNGLVHYRAHTDVKIGRISAGLTYLVPSSGYTLANNDVLGLAPDWDAAKVGASLMFWLF
jgi:hypothetical protein